MTLGGLGIGPLVGVILGLSDVRRRPRGVAMAGIALNGLALCGLAAFILLLVVLGLGRTDPGGSPSF
ncbi:hypothetical protein [Clavibacter sp. B3I6]|uniref:hypothetical protein n=1 Tax=Clavibacter sp. B3I6 TaxID=3042268 RepID=UPI0027D8895C|nr:hypothetical protein [Clavibacter sp. B3I6]